MIYTVTGATGHLGQLVVKQLLTLVKADEIRAMVHTPSKATWLHETGVHVVKGDYLAVDSMVDSLKGTDVLVYIPSKTYNIVQRVTELENTLAAMEQAAVTTMIFVSFFADQENNPFRMSAYYGYAPRRLAAAGVKYAIVKNSLYADPLVPYLPELIERKQVIYPVGDAALAFITQADSAEVIAKLAIQPNLRDRGQHYLLTQEKSYSMPELAAIMSRVTNKPIGYAPVTVPEFAKIYEAEGDGSELASMYAGGALGLLSEATTDFETITGHKPQGMAEFLSEHYKK